MSAQMVEEGTEGEFSGSRPAIRCIAVAAAVAVAALGMR
jgi:hypothetical protein